VCALTGMGIGAVVRHSPTTIVTTTVVLLLLPVLIDSNHRQWVIDVHNAMPYIVWERLVQLDQSPQGPTITGSWIVLAAWALVSVIVAIAVVDRRDL
jgi:ABC-2 type transport system permease protein